ncbi:MAG: hypothetical protein ACRDCW_14000 [Sarcina sp.]
MKVKVLGAITAVAVVVLVSGAIAMNLNQQTNYSNKHKSEITAINQDLSYFGTHLKHPKDDQEAF